MSRLSQLYPSNYKASSQISNEFEQLIRYINAAELGNRTIGELLAQIFDGNGTWSGPLEIKIDTSLGLVYRVGTYTNPAEGWRTIASLSDLRGAPGSNFATIDASPLLPPAEFVATANQTTFGLAADFTENFLVFRNGVLQREGALNDYTVTRVAGFSTQNIVMNAPQPLNTRIAIVRVRAADALNFVRTEHVTTGSQAVFAFNASLQNADIFVYLNGVFQREGGAYDYVRQSAQPTITFNTAIAGGNAVSILGFASTGLATVPGLMLERDFVDVTTGLIKPATIGFADNGIPANKVADLATLYSQAARIHIGNLPPANPTAIRLWLDTSIAPNTLKVWDGATWLRTSVENILPSVTPQLAGSILKVNSLGTNYELGTVDLSALVPKTWIGAANGAAALDANGRLPITQLPEAFPADSIYFLQPIVGNADYTIKRIYGQRIRITGIAARLSGGTANIRLSVGGTPQGPTVGVSSSPVEQPLATPIEVDASTALRTLGVTVSSAVSPANLEISLSARAII